jgi:hypothetical protein
VLKRYGMENFKGTIDELKDYVEETLRTGSAQEIRENIKYLNEKRQKPTQEALGVTYIERPEDYKDEGIKGETELYTEHSNLLDSREQKMSSTMIFSLIWIEVSKCFLLNQAKMNH